MTLSDGRTLRSRLLRRRVPSTPSWPRLSRSLGADTVAVRFLGDGTADLHGIVVLAKQTTAIDGYITAAGRPYVVGSTEKQSAVVAGREGVWRDRGLTWPTAIAPRARGPLRRVAPEVAQLSSASAVAASGRPSTGRPRDAWKRATASIVGRS